MFVNKNKGGVLLKLAIVLVVLGAVAVAIFFSIQRPALVVAVKRGTAIDAVTGSVRVDADGGVRDLKSEAGGKIKSTILVDNLQFKEGDALVQLDTTDLDRQIDAAERNYKNYKERARLNRESNIQKQVAEEKLADAKRHLALGNASEEQVRDLQRALDAVVSGLEMTDFAEKEAEENYKVAQEDFRILKEKMTVRAPYDGSVDQVLIKRNELIGAGHVVARILENRRIIAAKVSEDRISKVKVGQKARVRLLSHGDETFDTTVTKIHPVADDAQRFTVFLDVKSAPETLNPSSTGEVTITVNQRENQIVIPRRALVDGRSVYVVKGGVVERRPVEIGFDSSLNAVEILKGLEVGEHIIVDFLDTHRPGQRVKAQLVQ